MTNASLALKNKCTILILVLLDMGNWVGTLEISSPFTWNTGIQDFINLYCSLERYSDIDI